MGFLRATHTHMTTIEIQGKKFEVTEEQTKLQKIETISIGTKVKVLVADYSDKRVFPGVVVAIDLFSGAPQVTVVYLNDTYGSPAVCSTVISESSKTDLVISSDPIHFWSMPEIERKIRSEIEDSEKKIKDLKAKYEWIKDFVTKNS